MVNIKIDSYYENKSQEQLNKILVRRYLREVRDESQDSVDNLLDNYIMGRITQAALLDLSDLLINEMEIIDEILDEIDRAGRVNQEVLANLPRLTEATKLTIEGYESHNRVGKIDVRVFSEWEDNRVRKDNLVNSLAESTEWKDN